MFISSPETSGLHLVVVHNQGSVTQVVTTTDFGHAQQLAYQERRPEGDDSSGIRHTVGRMDVSGQHTDGLYNSTPAGKGDVVHGRLQQCGCATMGDQQTSGILALGREDNVHQSARIVNS